MEGEGGEKTLCKQQSQEWSLLPFSLGVPILICALQSLLLSQVCISPSQLFFISPKTREDDKIEADVLPRPGLVVTSKAGELPWRWDALAS